MLPYHLSAETPYYSIRGKASGNGDKFSRRSIMLSKSFSTGSLSDPIYLASGEDEDEPVARASNEPNTHISPSCTRCHSRFPYKLKKCGRPLKICPRCRSRQAHVSHLCSVEQRRSEPTVLTFNPVQWEIKWIVAAGYIELTILA